MDKSLRTWRLTPNKDSDLWNQSSYRGEVWVRAYDAIEARKLTAQRFRVRPRSSDRRRARMESPWYVRELTHCEVDQNPRFDSVEMPCVVCPVPEANMVSDIASNARAERAVIAQEPATYTAHPNTAAQLQRASHDVEPPRDSRRLHILRGWSL